MHRKKWFFNMLVLDIVTTLISDYIFWVGICRAFYVTSVRVHSLLPPWILYIFFSVLPFLFLFLSPPRLCGGTPKRAASINCWVVSPTSIFLKIYLFTYLLVCLTFWISSVWTCTNMYQEPKIILRQSRMFPWSNTSILFSPRVGKMAQWIST